MNIRRLFLLTPVLTLSATLKKEHKLWFDKNRTHDFRTTSRCAGHLLDHSGDRAIHPQSNCDFVRYLDRSIKNDFSGDQEISRGGLFQV